MATARKVTRRVLGVVALCGLALGGACSGDDNGARPGVGAVERAADAPAPAPAPARPRVVVLGDSIAAGLGLPRDESFPARLQQKIDEAGLNYEVVNAGVSGDTTAGGVRRLDWALEGDVRVLVLELGANDGLRGLPIDEMTRNLSTIIERARARNIAVLLCGMEAPPNFGPAYTSEYRAAFARLAKEHQVPFVPFVLDGVAGLREMNQADGIHPNSEGARKVADTVWAELQPLLVAASAS
ncbi:MAG TPA: arylesterase [Vicinamibacterales bacterium]